MLDLTNVSLNSQETQGGVDNPAYSRAHDDDSTLRGIDPSPASAGSSPHGVSLPEIAVRSHTMRANLGIDSGHATPVWPSLFNAPSSFNGTPVMHSLNLPPPRPSTTDDDSGGESEAAPPALSQTATEIISDLQQKLLQVQTELQFELWLKREKLRHVGRLHEDHVMTRRAELERQQLVSTSTMRVLHWLMLRSYTAQQTARIQSTTPSTPEAA